MCRHSQGMKGHDFITYLGGFICMGFWTCIWNQKGDLRHSAVKNVHIHIITLLIVYYFLSDDIFKFEFAV